MSHAKSYASPACYAAAERTWRSNKVWTETTNAANRAAAAAASFPSASASAHVLGVDGPFADLTHAAFQAEVLGIPGDAAVEGVGATRRDGGFFAVLPPGRSTTDMDTNMDTDMDTDTYTDIDMDTGVGRGTGTDIVAGLQPPPPLPPSADWVGAGAVGPVFNQGKCGSCWAVASVEAMEVGGWGDRARGHCGVRTRNASHTTHATRSTSTP